MRNLVKPFWYFVGAIHFILKIATVVIMYPFALLWTFSVKESNEAVKEEFEYFYSYTIFRGSTVVYQYKTIHDFVNGNKCNKLKWW